jgi:hypothetical protein
MGPRRLMGPRRRPRPRQRNRVDLLSASLGVVQRLGPERALGAGARCVRCAVMREGSPT